MNVKIGVVNSLKLMILYVCTCLYIHFPWTPCLRAATSQKPLKSIKIILSQTYFEMKK